MDLQMIQQMMKEGKSKNQIMKHLKNLVVDSKCIDLLEQFALLLKENHRYDDAREIYELLFINSVELHGINSEKALHVQLDIALLGDSNRKINSALTSLYQQSVSLNLIGFSETVKKNLHDFRQTLSYTTRNLYDKLDSKILSVPIIKEKVQKDSIDELIQKFDLLSYDIEDQNKKIKK